jgi:dipeptidyl aminopeptidase/acylaminoacyl peptidase
VLLIHGDKDLDVPFEQSVLMDQELTSKKIKHKFIRMENYGHGFDNKEGAFDTPDVKKVFADIQAFLKEHQ